MAILLEEVIYPVVFNNKKYDILRFSDHGTGQYSYKSVVFVRKLTA